MKFCTCNEDDRAQEMVEIDVCSRAGEAAAKARQHQLQVVTIRHSGCI